VAEINVSNSELRTIRDAMRELNRMVDSLDRGETEKFVLVQRNKMRAVVVSLDHFSSMQRQLAGLPED
jgi:PHD/YefM family antitoxin component YafN of YafNO toxin-antitoxin module